MKYTKQNHKELEEIATELLKKNKKKSDNIMFTSPRYKEIPTDPMMLDQRNYKPLEYKTSIRSPRLKDLKKFVFYVDMPRKQKLVLVLHVYRKLSAKRISEKLGLSKQIVWNYIYLAKQEMLSIVL